MTYREPTIAAAASFTTAKGSKITVAIESERDNIADHNFRAPCWCLTASVNGDKRTLPPMRKTHPVHGQVLDMGEIVAPIPASALQEIDAVFAIYSAEVMRRNDALLSQDLRFADHDRLSRDMNRANSNN